MSYGSALDITCSLTPEQIDRAIESLRAFEPPSELNAVINGQSAATTLELCVDVFVRGRVVIFSADLGANNDQLTVFGFATKDNGSSWRSLGHGLQAKALTGPLSNPQMLLAAELLQLHLQVVERSDQSFGRIMKRFYSSVTTFLETEEWHFDVENGLQRLREALSRQTRRPNR